VELAATQHISVVSNQIYNQGAWGVITHDFPDPENGPAGCEGGVWESNSGICTWFSRGNYVANNVFTNNGGFGNPTNGDIANQASGASDASACPRNQTSPCTPAANPDPNCFANNTLTSSTSEWPSGLQEAPCPPGSSESGVLTQQLLCATGATSLFTQGTGLTPPPCNVPGSNYPQHNATSTTCSAPAVPTPASASADVAVCFLPLSYTLSPAVSPSMPNQCAGVPPNAFCAHSWRLQSIPNPSGAKASSLSSVACPSATLCTAVGSYTNSAGVIVTLAERWNGTSWAVQTTPNPTGARASSLNDVACPSTTLCTAVGSYTNSAGVIVTLAERWNGTSWAVQTTPNPSGATLTVLRGVSCPSTSVCMGVGWHRNSSGLLVTLAERWSGGTWAIQATPNPSATPGSGLHRVSCVAATACLAVGDSNNAGALVTLAESWNGSNWAIQATPNPSGARSSSLQGVSCSASSAGPPVGYVCTAVWVYTNSLGISLSLVERFNGSTWTIQSTPTPSGASSSVLPGVSCSAATTCTAVGSSVNSSGATTTLAEAWIGGTWVIQPTPNPGALTNVLSGVACPSTVLCSAVGYYKNGSGVIVTLAERYS
jgi:hypothetical protein